MKFYDRTEELEALKKIEKTSAKYAQMTIITGRRRIGKTTLIRKAFTGIPFVYFFVGKKSESLLCKELVEIIREELGEELGDFTSFARLFAVIMSISKRINFTLVLDEFQNFKYANESVFADMQDIWDSSKDDSRLNLVICGSIYSKMKRIFDDKDEPLYGRCTARFRIKPFTTSTLKEILGDFNPDYTNDDLLCLYMITGGVAKYVEQLMINDAVTKDSMIRSTLGLGSYFVDEAKEMLTDEFGKDYGNYFSILAALAAGNTTRGEIKSYTGIEPGGFLDNLEKDYDIVRKMRPYLSGEGSKKVRYEISDNFMNFWFRFIYKYRSAVEIQNMKYVQDKVFADYETYSGHILERYIRQQYRETGLYNVVTNYWDKYGSDEIDLVAINEVEHSLVIGEVKRNPEKINLETLKKKSAKILSHHNGWNSRIIGVSMEDM